MDHLLLPRNSATQFLNIPFLCNEQYDGGPFLTYPARTGWNVTVGQWPESLSRNGREISDENEIGSFQQTWLYLGLICEITGKPVDSETFKARERTRSASRFSSERLVDIVEKWSVEALTMSYEVDRTLLDRLGENAEFLGDPLETWLSNCLKVIYVVENMWDRIVQAYEDRSSATLNLVCLSIATLGDYLSQALADIAHRRHLDDDERSAIWLVPESISKPLLRDMQNWCPNRLHGFLNAQMCTVGVLWYIAHLEPPMVHDNHRTCTPERCNSLQVDQHDYSIKHISTECCCAFIGPSEKELIDIVRRGSIALFNVQQDAANYKVAVQDEDTVGQYIAISHVWADGHGNLETNSLPTCVLKKIQENVDALGASTWSTSHTPIWMDRIS